MALFPNYWCSVPRPALGNSITSTYGETLILVLFIIGICYAVFSILRP